METSPSTLSSQQLYECQICFDDELSRDNVYICYCKSVYCKNCIRQYSLSLNVEPKCMNPSCNIIYTWDILNNIFCTNKFKKQYSSHIKDILYSRESQKFQDIAYDNSLIKNHIHESPYYKECNQFREKYGDDIVNYIRKRLTFRKVSEFEILHKSCRFITMEYMTSMYKRIFDDMNDDF